jgi:RNA polymerase sigma-70 factor (family 1)
LNDGKSYDENVLASQIKNGNSEAFKLFYNLYKHKIFNFAYHYLKSASDAEETVQVVFVKLWEGRKEIKEHLSIRSYLFKITINHIYNNLKRKQTHLSYKDSELLKDGFDHSTQDNIYYDNLKENLDSWISQLPEQRRIIFKMSRIDGMSHDEIAKQLQLSVRTVESQVYKALKFLKSHLKDDFFLSIF